MLSAMLRRASFEQEGTVTLRNVDSVLANLDGLDQLVYTLVLPVQIKFDEFASRGVFVAEPTCEFVCDEVLEECLVGGIADESPFLVFGYSQKFLFFFEFDLVTGFGHSRETGVSAALDGQIKNVAFGGVFAVYL